MNRSKQKDIVGPWRDLESKFVRRERARRDRRRVYVWFALFLFGVACGWLGSLVYAAWTLWHMTGGAR